MHDPDHVVFHVVRPPLLPRELRPRRRRRAAEHVEDPEYRSHHVGPVIIRAKKHKCHGCGGTGEDEEWGYCRDCNARGFTRARLRHRAFLSTFIAVWRWEWYLPPLVTVWHHDPKNRSHGATCANPIKKRMLDAKADGALLAQAWWAWWWRNYDKFHPHHWQLQVHPWQAFKRYALDRCEGCGKPLKGAVMSESWGGLPRPSRFASKPGLWHMRCYDLKRAGDSAPPNKEVPDAR